MPSWTYKLTVINQLSDELELVSEHVPWGTREYAFPKVIKPGEVKTFSVYSAAGLAWGLEFYVSMRKKVDPSDKNAQHGGFDFFVDMPYYRGSNRSEFNANGCVQQAGFKQIPAHQHDFATTVRLFDMDKLAVEDTEAEFEGYYKPMYSWQNLEKVKDRDDDAPINDFVPAENTLGNRFIVGRSKEFNIPKKLWHFINDGKYQDELAKRYFVDGYFTVAAYEVRRFPESINIHANQSLTQTVEITHTSTVRRETETNFLLENTLSIEAKDDSGSISDTLRAEFNIRNLKEYCDSSTLVEKQEISYGADPRDRTLVWWDLVKVIALYRKRKDGEVELIGIDDYFMFTVPKTYYEKQKTKN